MVTYGMSADYSAIASLEVDPGSGTVFGAPTVRFQEVLTPASRFAQIDVHDVKETPVIGGSTGPFNYIVSGAINDIPFTAKMNNNFDIDLAVEVSQTYMGEFNHMVYQEHLGGATSRALILSYFSPFDEGIPYVLEYDFGTNNLINMTLTELISGGAPFSGWSHYPASFATTQFNDPVLTANTYDATQGLPIIAFTGMNLTGACEFNQPSPGIDELVLANNNFRDIGYNPIGVSYPPFNSEPNPPIPMFSCNNPCPAPITASITPSNCLGGTPAMQLTASTSATNPNYLWIPGGQQTQSINITTPGTYTVVVSEPGTGCSETATFQADFLQVTVTVDNDEECDGICDAQVTANPTGGTPPYTYLWTFGGATTQTVSNLCNNIGGFGTPDNVTVTDANGCTVQSAPVSIGTNQPGPGFEYTGINITDVPCYGVCVGEIDFTLNPLAGVANYNYNWNDGSTAPPLRDELCSGTYDVTVTNTDPATGHQCSLTEVFTINENAASTWHKYSQSSDFTTVVDVESDLDDNIYVMGTFYNTATIEDITITSGNADSGMYVVKYNECGTFQWVAFTHLQPGETFYITATDMEFRENQLHILFYSSNQYTIAPPEIEIWDSPTNQIAAQSFEPLPNPVANYVLGSIVPGGTAINNLHPVLIPVQLPDGERLTSVEYVHMGGGSWEYLLGGRVNNQAFVGEVEVVTAPAPLPAIDAYDIVSANRTPVGGSNTYEIVTEYKNPLLKSGLLFTGSDKLLKTDNVFEFNREEGILTAYEAMNLSLDHTELVVLSACETGRGEIQAGEGVFGLQRAFKVAGADAIIMTLFKVDDEATQKLMKYFYGYWLESGDKREAFLKAKQQIKQQYDSPIYWGSFIMIGGE